MAQRLELPLRLLHKVGMLSAVVFGRSSWCCCPAAAMKGQHRALLRLSTCRFSRRCRESVLLDAWTRAHKQGLNIRPVVVRPMRTVHFMRTIVRRKRMSVLLHQLYLNAVSVGVWSRRARDSR